VIARGAPAPRSDGPDGAAAPAAHALAVLLRLLQAEGAALTAGDVDAVARIVPDKEAALRSLALQLADSECTALAEPLRRARDLNRRNARLLAPHAKANRARIETLFGAARCSTLYSPDGRAAGPQGRPGPRGVRA
jgi:flagellar biosynthesis/type III secretory pathway chaperone